METPDLHRRVIRSNIDVRLLISELASPDCTLQTLKVDIQNYGQLNRPLGLPTYEDAMVHVTDDACMHVTHVFLQVISPDNFKLELTNVLGKSKSLKALDISFCSDFLMAGELCKRLQSNEVLESLTVCTVIAARMSQEVGRMLEKNKTLKHLQIVNSFGNCYDLADLARGLQSHSTLEQLTVDSFFGKLENIESIFKMLEENTKMNRLDLRIGRGHGSWAPHASSMLQKNCTLTALTLLGAPGTRLGRETLSHVLSPFCGDATTGKQANNTLIKLQLTVCNSEELQVLANMLCKNRTIRELLIHSVSKNYVQFGPEDIVYLLDALEGNNTLRLLDLSGCSAVEGYQNVYDAILNCLNTRPWLHLNLQNTPLSRVDYRFSIIQLELDRNAEFVKNWNPSLVSSKGARVFLCGPPRAGKTALRRSLVQSNVARHHSKMWKPLLAFNQMGIKGALFGEKQDERTRGIEISVVEDGGIVVSIWDLAGQEEFHAFHDYMMPNFADFVNPCSFLFVFDPTKQTNRVEKMYGRKELKEFEDDLTYWLQFIASNTPTSTTFRPRLLVILTHADRDLDGGLVEWAKHVVDELRKRFQNVVHIFTDIYAVNARSSDHVIPVLDFVLKDSRYLLSRTQVFPECVAMRLLLSNRIRGHPNQPIISWSTFSELCNEILPEGMGESSQLDVVERKRKALAAHLHHMGDIIYFQGLEFIVVNPGWFCHNIMGFVINFRGIQHMTDKGFATKEYMQHVLNQSWSFSTKNILSGGWGIHLQPADLMHLMLKLNICYEKDPGNLDAGVFIPAILDANFSATERAAIAEGKRKLVWPIPTSQAPVKAIFVGRRLECNNPFHTFLTPGFFPRLQVVLHNAFYSNGSLSVDYKLDKGLIILNFKGIEVLVESSGDVGYYIDVLVRSSLSHSETLKIIEEDILKTIHQYCASSDGCRGVWLVESILRPQCVQELTLLKYRKDQAVATEALKQELLMVGCNMNHKYTWKAVIEKGANNSDSPIVVLGSGHDLAVELLGEQGTTNFMEWRWSELEEVSFKLNDVKAPPEILGEDEDTAVTSDVFRVTAPLRRTLSGYHEATMENMERGFNLLLQHQEAVGDRIIASFKEECAQMKMAERELQHELCKKVDALMEFTVQFQQRNIPQLAYCVRKEGMISFGKLVTCFIPGLHSARLHLMCEHIDGIHDVEGQKGFEVMLESETFHKIRPLLDKGLQILSILLKVGAQLTTGLAAQVPMLKVGSGILGGAATVIPAQLPTMIGCDDASVSRLVGKEVAEKWLVDTMKQVPDIAETFDLHKVVYTGRCNGQVAWVCGKHKAIGLNDKSLREVHSG